MRVYFLDLVFCFVCVTMYVCSVIRLKAIMLSFQIHITDSIILLAELQYFSFKDYVTAASLPLYIRLCSPSLLNVQTSTG